MTHLGFHSQLRVELARGTALLALTSITTSVATLAVATALATATAEGTTALLLTEHATGGSVRALLLDVGSGNDLGGQVEPLAQVVETLGGEGVVVYNREDCRQSWVRVLSFVAPLCPAMNLQMHMYICTHKHLHIHIRPRIDFRRVSGGHPQYCQENWVLT